MHQDFGHEPLWRVEGSPSTAVSRAQESPFRFTGTFDRVEIELLGRVGPHPTVALRTEMGRQ